MSDYPMLISNKLHSFRNFSIQKYVIIIENVQTEALFHQKNIKLM